MDENKFQDISMEEAMEKFALNKVKDGDILEGTVIKSSKESGVVFDTPGTDTAKHTMAGADSVMFVGPDKMVLQAANDNLHLLALAYRYFPDVDIVIGEGFKDARKVAKIEVLRDRERMLRKR